ncbi:MAG TPA: hypothetical protein VHA15_10750 [Burkholderiales bacterium]|nr:hypothetical protein [Burkholderiales bacterium]
MANFGMTTVDILLDDVDVVRKIQLEQQALKPGGLVPGAYYRGYLGNAMTVGRWNREQLRFVVWVPAEGRQWLKGARHVLESGIGDAFAPLEPVQVEKEQEISDFDLNTIR